MSENIREENDEGSKIYSGVDLVEEIFCIPGENYITDGVFIRKKINIYG